MMATVNVFLALLPLTFAFPYPYPDVDPYGVNSNANAIGTANAKLGHAESQGRTFTDPFGTSIGDARSRANGEFPSATSIANSNTARLWKRNSVDVLKPVENKTIAMDVKVNASNPAVFEELVRTRRDDNTDEPNDETQDPQWPIFDIIIVNHTTPIEKPIRTRRSFHEGPYNPGPYGYGRHAAGTAIGTASALEGRSNSEGHTFTGGGVSRSDASGFAEGVNPSSTSIANSESNRRRRDVFVPWPYYNPGASYATATGNANAAEGRSDSSGHTVSAGGNSASNAQGASVGVHPASNAVASSSGRYKREVSPVAASEKILIAPATGMAIGDKGNVLTARGLTQDGKTFLVQSDASSAGSGASSSSFSSTSS